MTQDVDNPCGACIELACFGDARTRHTCEDGNPTPPMGLPVGTRVEPPRRDVRVTRDGLTAIVAAVVREKLAANRFVLLYVGPRHTDDRAICTMTEDGQPNPEFEAFLRRVGRAVVDCVIERGGKS